MNQFLTYFAGSSFLSDYPQEVTYSPEEANWKVAQAVIITALITVTVTFCLFSLVHYLINRRKHNVFFGDYHSEIVRHNRIVPLPLPKREGYTFCGWYRDEELTNKWLPTDLVKRDTYLFPKWEEGDDLHDESEF